MICRAAAKGHPWPSAAKPASCRFTLQLNIEVRPAWFDGALKIKIKKQSQSRVESVWSVFQVQERIYSRSVRGSELAREGLPQVKPFWLLILLWLWLWLLILTCSVGRPSAGFAQWATRHGCRVSRPWPGMADGGGPTEQNRSEGMSSPGEAPDVRGESAWLLGAFPSNPP